MLDTPYRYYNDPCCSTNVLKSDTLMCDTSLQFESGFQFAASGCYDICEPDAEVESLMHTLCENPDFFDSEVYCAPPSTMMLHNNCEGGNYGSAEQQPRLFTTEFYETSLQTPTPVVSPVPAPPVTSSQLQFEDFSLATQLPVLSGYAVPLYSDAEAAATVANPAIFQNFEPYSAQYFFTTPPNTPPDAYPVSSLPMPSIPPLNQTTSSKSDPTPTIRRLLQQKKKRAAAVPCHINSVCTTCQTRTTSLWRRNHLGEIECNACNLYFRKNNCKRPVTLRKDEILKRKRKPRLDSNHANESTPSATDNDIKPKLFS